MQLSLFDLHCDTAYELYRRGESLAKNSLSVTLHAAKSYRNYVQVMAHWTDPHLSDEEGWESCLAIYHHLCTDTAIQSEELTLCTTLPSLPLRRPCLLLAVEDARILAGNEERVDHLAKMGFRIMTPLWAGVTCIGGAHDTREGLTAFGRAALRRALQCGMLLDVSHASEASTEEILALSAEYTRPILATHSNAFSVCPVSRNLKKEQILAIVASGGLIGINLHVPFLTEREDATTEDILRHIEAFLSLGAERSLCFGGDWDGARLPVCFSKQEQLLLLAEAMLKHNYSETTVHSIFFENAYRFAEMHLR